MAKFVETDERIKFKDQSEEKIGAPLILINKFNVHPDKVIAVVFCLKNIQSNVSQSKRRMGVISTNIFERQSVVDENNELDERWLMIHHHGPPVSNFIPPNVSI